MSTVLSKLLVFGVVVGASVGATALPASAAPTDGSPPSVAQVWEVGATFKIRQGINLGPGKIVKNDHTKVFFIREDANHMPQSIYVKYDSWFNSLVAFPIRQNGQDTGYWVQTALYSGFPSVVGTCEIFQGELGPGAEPVWESPFECITEPHEWTKDFDFLVGWNRDAKVAAVSGTVAPSGPVPDGLSLTDGQYETDQFYHQYGATDLAVNGINSSTTFSAVAIKGDIRYWDPVYNDQARMEYSYQIVDRGSLTGYYMAGMVSNYRGMTRFAPDAHCGIYTTPLGDGSRLDDHTPVDDSPYTCSTTGHVVSGDNEYGSGHYHADFTLGRK